MNSYQLHLLLEGLTRIYSVSELGDGLSIIVLLMRNFGVSQEDAEAVVEGALHLKKVRLDRGSEPSLETYLQ